MPHAIAGANLHGVSASHTMVVEVATDDDQGVRVLLDDVLGDLDHPLGTVFELLLLSWLDIAVEHLYDVVPNLQLCPA